MEIRRAAKENLTLCAELALELWPENEAGALEAEFSEILEKELAIFLAYEDDAVGFAQCQLRRDYVEGTATTPVGYLEGIYVREGHRGKGIAKALLAACEDWARAQGCREFASDCELDNDGSLAFHLRMGFTEANRIICFTKEL